MKIFTNVQRRRVGGITQALSSFIDYSTAPERAHEITGMEFQNSDEPSHVKTLKSPNFYLHVIKLRIPSIIDLAESGVTIEELRQSYGEIIEWYYKGIIEGQPDVVLVNGTYYLSWCLFTAARKAGVPTVVHYHGNILKETEHWPAPARELMRAMESEFYQTGVAFVFPSRIALNSVPDELSRNIESNAVVLPNAVSEHYFAAAAAPTGAVKKIGIVGRWDPIKNTEFIRRFAQYLSHTNSEYSLHVVTDLRANNPEWIALEHLVNFHESMGQEELRDFYASVSVVLSPSYFETYGNVAVEALASGTPVLVSKTMGVSETFRALGLAKWVIDFEDEMTVYEQIELIGNERVPDEIRRMLWETNSPEEVYSQLLRVLERHGAAR